MPAKRKPSKHQAAAARQRARSQRMAKVWDLFMREVPMSTIASIVGCAPQTVKNDITDTEQALKELDALHAVDTRERAVGDRRHLKNLSLEASAETEPKDRGPLLGEARKNQDGIEELEGLHPKEPPVLQVGPTLIQIGEGAPPRLPEALTDDELEQAIAETASALPTPAPDEAEEPAAEYMQVEEPAPAETSEEAPPEPDA